MTAHKIMLVTKLLLQSFVLLTGFLSLLAQSMSQEVCKGKFGASSACPRHTTGSPRCYVCDTDVHKFCEDPFNRTLVMKRFRQEHLKKCNGGCCLKQTFKNNSCTLNMCAHAHARAASPHAHRIVRDCTANEAYVIDTHLVSRVCITEYQQLGEMCLCENDLCNTAAPRAHTLAYITAATATALALFINT
jgi:hypothetical protein